MIVKLDVEFFHRRKLPSQFDLRKFILAFVKDSVHIYNSLRLSHLALFRSPKHTMQFESPVKLEGTELECLELGHVQPVQAFDRSQTVVSQADQFELGEPDRLQLVDDVLVIVLVCIKLDKHSHSLSVCHSSTSRHTSLIENLFQSPLPSSSALIQKDGDLWFIVLNREASRVVLLCLKIIFDSIEYIYKFDNLIQL